jgi:hypothetical protein
MKLSKTAWALALPLLAAPAATAFTTAELQRFSVE